MSPADFFSLSSWTEILLRPTGFLQGWSFTVAHAQSCRWVEIGSLVPVREFLCGIIECALRLFGPASCKRQLVLSPEAGYLMHEVHDRFEEQKLSAAHRSSMRDYFSKHSQWVGSFATLDHVEREALRYLSFVLNENNAPVNHRTADPRGNPTDPPVLCARDQPVVVKKCLRNAKKSQRNDVGRYFWGCATAGDLVLIIKFPVI